MRKTLVIMMAALAIGSVSPSYAQILDKYVEDGKTFLACGEGHKAFQSLAEGDRVNNINTRYYLALCYAHGYGVEKDASQAFSYMRKAAESGNDDAKAECALMLVRGEGVAKNEAKAKYWVEKLLMAHKPQGYYLKGVMLTEGLYYAKDVTAGREMLEKAISKGNNAASVYLAFQLANEDTNRAMSLMQSACEAENNNYMVFDKMGELLLASGMKDAAKELWNEMTTNSPAYGMEFYTNFTNSMKDMCPMSAKLIAQYESSAKNSDAKPSMPKAPVKNESVSKPASTTQDNRTAASTPAIAYKPKATQQDTPKSNNSTQPQDKAAGQNATKEAISDVDMEIPVNSSKNESCFAVIIGNENYQEVDKVPFANRDSEVFSEYCLKTLGMPQSNVHLIKDATLNNIKREINWLEKIADAYGSDASIIFYYAGHGIPDESTRNAYLLPIDGFGSDVSTGYSLSNLYAQLGSLKAKSITVFLDACFSGASRDGGMVASARGVAIAPKKSQAEGNVVILSATQDDETAYPLKEEKHGLFTYFLLKKLKQTRGAVSLGELSDFITDNVRKKSIVINGKSQTPSVNVSNKLTNQWREISLK